jgi:hypothetical protein
MSKQYIKSRKTKEPAKSYLFTARLSLWNEIEATANELDVSIAHLIRQSLKKQIADYRKNCG